MQTSSPLSLLPPPPDSPPSAPPPPNDFAESPIHATVPSPPAQRVAPPFLSPSPTSRQVIDAYPSPSLRPAPTPSPSPPHSPTPTVFSSARKTFPKLPLHSRHTSCVNPTRNSAAPPKPPTFARPTPLPLPAVRPPAPALATSRPLTHFSPATPLPPRPVVPTPPNPSALFPASPKHSPPLPPKDHLPPLPARESSSHDPRLHSPFPTAHPPPRLT